LKLLFWWTVKFCKLVEHKANQGNQNPEEGKEERKRNVEPKS